MKIKVLCGIFCLSALTCAAQTATPDDSLRMDSIIHNLPEVMAVSYTHLTLPTKLEV